MRRKSINTYVENRSLRSNNETTAHWLRVSASENKMLLVITGNDKQLSVALGERRIESLSLSRARKGVGPR